MGFGNLFSPKTPLQKAIRRGMKRGGDLQEELSKLNRPVFRTEAEADDVCVLIRRVLVKGSAKGGPNAAGAILSLCDDVEPKSPAAEFLFDNGIPMVLLAFDNALQDPTRLSPENMLSALQLVIRFYPQAGVETLICAVRKELAPGNFSWPYIFGYFPDGSAELEEMFRQTRECLPTGLAGFALLERANEALEAGAAQTHPFDSPAGLASLERLLHGENPTAKYRDEPLEHPYAVTATAALRFVNGAKRDELLEIAFKDPSLEVRFQAMCVAAYLGQDSGLTALAQACLDIRVAERARLRLEKLGRDDLVPPEARTADFKARANFAEWLADYRELGRPPDEVEIVDHRELLWPPERLPIPVWLLRYRATGLPSRAGDRNGQEPHADDDQSEQPTIPDTTDDEGVDADDEETTIAADDFYPFPTTTDVGFVGSMTFCMFGFGVGNRSPEDAYAMHCYHELQWNNLISEDFVDEGGDDDDEDDGDEDEVGEGAAQEENRSDRLADYVHLLERCTIPGIESARIVRVAEFAEGVQYPAKLVAIASGTLAGERGWVVLDGPRTRWYPRSEAPVSFNGLVLMVHVGRVLLGFTDAL